MKNAKKSGEKQKSLFKNIVPRMLEGYYSGDKPNPNLKVFVEQHIKEKPYDPETDEYNVPAFDKPIETTKATVSVQWQPNNQPGAQVVIDIDYAYEFAALHLDPITLSGSSTQFVIR